MADETDFTDAQFGAFRDVEDDAIVAFVETKRSSSSVDAVFDAQDARTIEFLMDNALVNGDVNMPMQDRRDGRCNTSAPKVCASHLDLCYSKPDKKPLRRVVNEILR